MNTRKQRKLCLYEAKTRRIHSCLPREQYYKGIQEDPRLNVKLTGNWETLVGDQDTFVHILEYENYAGYDKTSQLVRSSEV